MNDNYDDIINLPHPVSKNHPQMPMASRAAQFAPFAALTGYGEAINETVRENEEMFMQGEEEGEDSGYMPDYQ
jgi:hypothetical protein